LLLHVGAFFDLAVVTVLITTGHPDFFVLYYPVALAYALVFVRKLTLIFTAVMGIVYTTVSLMLPPGIQFNGDEETLAIQLVTLLATALLATMYWRIQRTRRPQGA
jgi:hypothetical protein